MLTSVLVHAGLHHGRTIYNAVLGRKGEEDDIHQKLMEAYPEVPGWIYAVMGAVAFGLSIVATQVWHTGTPFWVTIVAVMLPAIYILPTTFLYANTGIAVCCGSSCTGDCLLTPNIAPLEPDFADYSRVTRTWGCHGKYGKPSSRFHHAICIKRHTVIQSLRYSTHVDGYPVHTGSQVGSLYEDSSSHNFLRYASRSHFT